jgi:predicted amidophosphoribosyltransferase
MNACPNCAAEQDDESRFCSECGTALKPELTVTVTEGTRDSPVDGSAYSALSGDPPP